MEFFCKTFDELTTTELYEILKSRDEIFSVEQKILYTDEDNTDYASLHCFFMDNKRVVAYLRAYYADASKQAVKIGRVLTLEHNRGFRRMLMQQSLPVIKHHFQCNKICMDAQKYAEDFYKKFGFATTSSEYLEEGIVHVDMELCF